MESKFKEGECVQLIHGESPKMTIAQVQFSPVENIFRITCSWFDKKGIGKTQQFIESVLKHCDDIKSEDDIDEEDIMSWRKFIKEKNERDKSKTNE